MKYQAQGVFQPQTPLAYALGLDETKLMGPLLLFVPVVTLQIMVYDR